MTAAGKLQKNGAAMIVRSEPFSVFVKTLIFKKYLRSRRQKQESFCLSRDRILRFTADTRFQHPILLAGAEEILPPYCVSEALSRGSAGCHNRGGCGLSSFGFYFDMDLAATTGVVGHAAVRRPETSVRRPVTS